jgi:spermidine/putrescine transport system permease protein
MQSVSKKSGALVYLLFFLLSARAGSGQDVPALHLLCWSEYVPQTVLAPFTGKTGIPVQVENYSSNEQMLEKLRARPGYYDVIQPSGFYVETLAARGELEALNFAHIPNVRHLDPKYRHLPFDPQGAHSIPWLAGTVGIVVNTARVREPVETWAEVFTGRYSGRIVVVDDAREMVTWALASLGLPITDVSDAALAQIRPVLAEWLPQVHVFNSDSPHAAMLDGRADVGIMWSGEAALLWQKDRHFRYVLPTQGAHMFVDNLAIPKGTPHRAAAESFLNHCLEPEVSVLISNAYPYTNPNRAARRLLSAEQLANPASYPPAELKLPMLRNEGNSAQAIAAFVGKIPRGAR